MHDGLGSVVGEVDVNGALLCQKKTDVYGISRGNVGTALSRHGFVGSLGHYSDDETGLVYMRARYYDPSIGRFISEDPAKRGLNWFAYCSNNPANMRDRSGKDGEMIETLGVIGEGEGLEAGSISSEEEFLAELRANTPPDKLTGFGDHAITRFEERFRDMFGNNFNVDNLLEKWNPNQAFRNTHGNWQCMIRMRGIVMSLVADDAGEVVTLFE